MKRLVTSFMIMMLVIFMMACQLDDPLPIPNEQPDVTNQNENDTPKEKSSKIVSRDTSTSKTEKGQGGFLWKVEQGDTTVYLQGTVHIGVEDFYPFHEEIEKAYESSDIIVPEVDVTEIGILSSLKSTLLHGTYLDGSTVKDHISEEQYTKLTKVFEEFGLPISVIGYFKPWMLAVTIDQLIAQQLGFVHGVDLYFLERAKEDGKEIIELETAEGQLAIFSDTSREFQAKQLEASLDGIDDFEDEMNQLFSLYLAGDVDRLLHYLAVEDTTDSDEEDLAFMDALNDQRNVKMAEKIVEFLEEDSDLTYFVIVGALHLIMEPHIRSILEEKGYKVEHIH